jgi:hypothetical protein
MKTGRYPRAFSAWRMSMPAVTRIDAAAMI